MARIYEQYVTGADRDFMVLEREQELFNEKIDFMLESIERERELNKREAEYIVLKENGTYDDLMYLYQEADAEAEGKKKGVFATIFAAIQKLINSIGNALANFGTNFVKKNPEQEIEIDKECLDVSNEIQKTWRENIGGGVKVAIKALAVAMGIGAAGAVVNHIFANFGKKNEDPNKQVGKIKMKARELDEKITKPITDIMNKINEFIGGIKSKFDKGGEGNNAKDDNNNNNNNGENTEGKQNTDNGGEDSDEKSVNQSHGILSFFRKVLGKIGPIDEWFKKHEQKKADGANGNNEGDNAGDNGGNNNGDNGGNNGGNNDNGGNNQPADNNTNESVNEFIESLLGFEFDDDEYFDESVDDDDEILDALDAIFA